MNCNYMYIQDANIQLSGVGIKKMNANRSFNTLILKYSFNGIRFNNRETRLPTDFFKLIKSEANVTLVYEIEKNVSKTE